MKIAVVVSGWHFPLHFYKKIAEQKIPPGWTVDLFCISHRDPKYSAIEKVEYMNNLGWSYREVLDKVLYAEMATEENMKALGWNYKLYPNTMGDWGNTNQWLEDHDYKKYDVLLVTHDDNLILSDNMYSEILEKQKKEWLIITNSSGSPLTWREYIRAILKGTINDPIGIRASFEFIKIEVLNMVGGKFDLSGTTLSMEGITKSQDDFNALKNWNNSSRWLDKLFKEKKLSDKILPLSQFYRVSKYCIEGERGYVSHYQKVYEKNENNGLKVVEKIKNVHAK